MTVNERRFVIDTHQHRDNAARYVARLPVDDGALELVVRPYVARRSSAQNARLWALHSRAAEELQRTILHCSRLFRISLD